MKTVTVGVLAPSPDKYRTTKPVMGFIEPSMTFNPQKNSLSFCDGSYMEVEKSDITEIEITETQAKMIFPLYE